MSYTTEQRAANKAKADAAVNVPEEAQISGRANRAQNRQTKTERIPVDGQRDIMTVHGKDPAYSYRWVEDSDERGSRIWKFKRGGWELATLDGEQQEMHVGQEAVYKSKQDGNLVRLHTGEAKFSYLMRIKKEWKKEDFQTKQANIDELEGGIMGTQTSQGDANNGMYGSVKFEK
jgi:hypothetical protein